MCKSHLHQRRSLPGTPCALARGAGLKENAEKMHPLTKGSHAPEEEAIDVEKGDLRRRGRKRRERRGAGCSRGAMSSRGERRAPEPGVGLTSPFQMYLSLVSFPLAPLYFLVIHCTPPTPTATEPDRPPLRLAHPTRQSGSAAHGYF